MAEAAQGAVVVGYDGSAQARAAVQWAAQEAVRRAASLHVAYAADYPGPVAPSWLPEEAVRSAASVAAEGAEHARAAAPGLEVTRSTSIGSPAGVLVDESRRASLLVVGTRGHGELLGALLGSVAFAVSAHAPCPVVVVRGDATARPGPDAPVVVGVDGSAEADQALRFAADTAADTGAPLVVTAAWRPPAGEVWEAAAWTTRVSENLGDAAERAARDMTVRAEAAALDAHPGLAVRREVVPGPAGRVLADLSAGAGLVVVGARGRGGFAGLLLGSVSHAVIHGATCPVAVVRGTQAR